MLLLTISQQFLGPKKLGYVGVIKSFGTVKKPVISAIATSAFLNTYFERWMTSS
jgi:hypothetical protein